MINELVATERSYVQRLRTLRDDYARPLREYAKNKDTLIIPQYEAKTLFGNVDQIVPVNEAFLVDLEKMVAPGGREVVGGVGDVALKHFKQLRGFELYRQYYSKREEAQKIFEAEIKKGSGLSTFIDVRTPCSSCPDAIVLRTPSFVPYHALSDTNHHNSASNTPTLMRVRVTA